MPSQSKLGKTEWLIKWAEVIWWKIYVADHFIHKRISVSYLAIEVYPNTQVFSKWQG